MLVVTIAPLIGSAYYFFNYQMKFQLYVHNGTVEFTQQGLT